MGDTWTVYQYHVPSARQMPLKNHHLVQSIQESLDTKVGVMSYLVYVNMQLIPPLSLEQLLLEVEVVVYSLQFEEVGYHQLLVEVGVANPPLRVV